MRRAALLAGVALALTAAGCGFGAGAGRRDVQVTVTEDFGGRVLGTSKREAPGEDTVLRLLERSFEVTTRYGGGFVQSIDGRAGGRRGGRSYDWFYYVNGIEAPRGSAGTRVEPGDRILWDLHDWGAAMDTPAITGQFPEPFLNGTAGKRAPVRLECAPEAQLACARTDRRLGEAGILFGRAAWGTGAGEDTLRVLVGPWREVRKSAAARQLERGPRVSGVYVRPTPDGSSFGVLDARGQTVAQRGPGTGLIAATRFEQQEPTWLVTGTDDAGVRAAANELTADDLRNRWAAIVANDEVRSVP